MGQNNRWLIVSYFLNIDGSASANWIDDRLPFLEKANKEIYLLSSFYGKAHQGRFNARVFSLSMSSLKVEIECILERRRWNDFWKRAVKIMVFLPFYPFYFLENKILKLGGESQWGWTLPAAIRALMICLMKRPAILYSSGGAVSPHFVCAIVSNLTGIPWIAELQDPLVCEDVGRNKFSKKALAYCEKVLFTYAKKVVFCTAAACQAAEKRYPLGKAVFIYPGAAATMIPVFKRDAKSGKCVFGHYGALFQTRNLGSFLTALGQLFSEHPDMVDHFALDLSGGIFGEAIHRQINDFPHKVIQYHGMVGRKEAIMKEITCDVLLLIQNTDERSAETIPSKFYEQLYLRKPILGLVYHNEELKTMLESHGHLTVDAKNSEEIKKGIWEYYRQWQEGSLHNTEKYAVSQLTVEEATARLIAIAESVTS